MSATRKRRQIEIASHLATSGPLSISEIARLMGGKYTTTHQDIKMCGSEYFKVEDGLVFVVKSPTYNATGPVEPVKVPAPVETINAPAPGQTCQHVMMTKAESVSYVAANRDTLVPLSKLSVPQLRKLSEYLLGGLEKL